MMILSMIIEVKPNIPKKELIQASKNGNIEKVNLLLSEWGEDRDIVINDAFHAAFESQQREVIAILTDRWGARGIINNKYLLSAYNDYKSSKLNNEYLLSVYNNYNRQHDQNEDTNTVNLWRNYLTRKSLRKDPQAWNSYITDFQYTMFTPIPVKTDFSAFNPYRKKWMSLNHEMGGTIYYDHKTDKIEIISIVEPTTHNIVVNLGWDPPHLWNFHTHPPKISGPLPSSGDLFCAITQARRVACCWWLILSARNKIIGYKSGIGLLWSKRSCEYLAGMISAKRKRVLDQKRGSIENDLNAIKVCGFHVFWRGGMKKFKKRRKDMKKWKEIKNIWLKKALSGELKREQGSPVKTETRHLIEYFGSAEAVLYALYPHEMAVEHAKECGYNIRLR